jgi:hypothetical protein
MSHKTWLGNDTGNEGEYAEIDNWALLSIRNPLYRWTASGSGTSEYYLELAGGGDPAITEPDEVLANSLELTVGTAGSLVASRWDWADNDTLGFNTVYVRLADSTDPDSKATDFVQFRGIPKATDHVQIPAASAAITANLDQSAVAIGTFSVADGYVEEIASSAGYLKIDPDRLEFAGLGESWIDVSAANILVKILKCATASAVGKRGLYLKGSNIATLDLLGEGAAGLAFNFGETSTIALVRVLGTNSDLVLGAGVTLTTLEMYRGRCVQRCGSTTTEVNGGTLTTEETGAITSLNVKGGVVIPNSTGTIGTLTIDGGKVDLTQSGAPRTITNVRLNSGILLYDPAVVTITNWLAPTNPLTLQASLAI